MESFINVHDLILLMRQLPILITLFNKNLCTGVVCISYHLPFYI